MRHEAAAEAAAEAGSVQVVCAVSLAALTAGIS